MRSTLLAFAFLAAVASPALANMCRTDTGKTCSTGMPIDGYCMCGDVGGTVVGGTQSRPIHPPPPPPPPHS
jgi:hypothetical protein